MASSYEQLVKALRRCDMRQGCFNANCRYSVGKYFCDMNKVHKDAASAIEELQAAWIKSETDSTNLTGRLAQAEADVERLKSKQRKLGRWEKAKPKGVVTYSDGYAECSSCHEVIWLGWGMNFCPHCGTQNKIIDPDDYDVAKMNDSNAYNESNALGNAQDGPIITPCRGCSDYDGYGGCKSKGGCARAKMEGMDASRPD